MDKSEEKKIDNTAKKKNLVKRIFLPLMLLVVILIAFFFFTSNLGDNSYDGDLLAADYVMDFPDPEGTRSGNDKTDKPKSDDPYKLYVAANAEKGSFQNAIKAFDQLIQTDDNPKHKFYQGISYLRISKWKEAELIFENNQLKELKNYPLNYYLAVAKIGLEKTDEAIKLLSNPTTGNALYNNEAEKIIKKLERMRSRKK